MMNSAAGASEAENPKTGMTHTEMKEFTAIILRNS
jgi:hypothetical protein